MPIARFSVGVILSAVVLAPLSAAGQSVPTFAKDVAPILYAKCVECHRPTMFAPMSLVKFDEARPWAKSIRNRVATRTMPPWGADPEHGVFKNDPRLSDQEIATILAWVDGGAPKGDDTDMPKMPEFADGWTIGTPDAVFEMQETFKIPATGTIEYQYLRIPTNLTEDKWLAAIEIKPQARAHVHHVIAYTQPAGEKISEAGVLGPGNIGGVTPNKPGVIFDPGVGRLLSANTDIILQMHYTTNGEATTDKTVVGVKYLKAPPSMVQRGGSVIQPGFVIPAGAPAHEVRGSRILAADTIITSFTPHMHMRGKDMTYIATYPDGRTETLLSVPKWDFNWQITYQLKEAKRMPKGTKIEVIAHFDNSPQNKFNPDPAKDVRWGDQTWEEMMIGFWGTVADRQPKQ
jgi:mono/diheme cytochrome c family protein